MKQEQEKRAGEEEEGGDRQEGKGGREGDDWTEEGHENKMSE